MLSQWISMSVSLLVIQSVGESLCNWTSPPVKLWEESPAKRAGATQKPWWFPDESPDGLAWVENTHTHRGEKRKRERGRGDGWREGGRRQQKNDTVNEGMVLHTKVVHVKCQNSAAQSVAHSVVMFSHACCIVWADLCMRITNMRRWWAPLIVVYLSVHLAAAQHHRKGRWTCTDSPAACVHCVCIRPQRHDLSENLIRMIPLTQIVIICILISEMQACQKMEEHMIYVMCFCMCTPVKECVYLLSGWLRHAGHQQIIFQRKATGLLLLEPLTEEIPFSRLT